jgi:hypothetical protein
LDLDLIGDERPDAAPSRRKPSWLGLLSNPPFSAFQT